MKGNAKIYRFGGFTIILTAIVVGIVVLANVLFGNLPSTVNQMDISRNKLTALSEETKQIVSSLEEDVEIDILCPEGSETGNDDGATLSVLLRRYADLSDHVKVVTKDPNEMPNLRTDYNISGTIYYYSLIVKSATRYRYIPLVCNAPTQGIRVTYTDYDNYDSGTDEYATYEQYEAEKSITSAIDYVTKADIPEMYVLTGHGELELSDLIAAEIVSKNIETKTLDLEKNGTVPEDCAALCIYSPSQDFSDNEAKAILEYAENGGKLFLITQEQGKEMPNLKSITDYFGVEQLPGIVIEGDSNYFSAYYGPYLLFPELKSHKITDSLIQANYRVGLPYASALEATGDDSATVTGLLKTSRFAYIKPIDADTLDKEDDDLSASFALAVVSEKTVEDSDKVPTLVWFSSAYALDFSDSNINMTTNTLNYLVGEAEGIAITTKTVAPSYLVLSGTEATIWTIILCGVVPALIILIGIFVVVRRKKQ